MLGMQIPVGSCVSPLETHWRGRTHVRWREMLIGQRGLCSCGGDCRIFSAMGLGRFRCGACCDVGGWRWRCPPSLPCLSALCCHTAAARHIDDRLSPSARPTSCSVHSEPSLENAWIPPRFAVATRSTWCAERKQVRCEALRLAQRLFCSWIYFPTNTSYLDRIIAFASKVRVAKKFCVVIRDVSRVWIACSSADDDPFACFS
ncbi:hypothetical protein CFBP2533_30690 [Xanthomonas hortorum pv. pelargonii]|uniref:Uncharacterized protein n=1 Tax=Xanthomonas hortorum pv. pelargonii TaxID=453602 RepID=A0A6V7E3B2_9XANT|nr:hypothetical protein CFBP2533_30690 [Xanthomonas hortorum pv. pelargonii]CAD0345338.1 hypothetical protein CFBP2533_30690 [Xanthomonas hortorum pv. pelargonii]